MSSNYDNNALNIYTDGSALSSPRKGGVGVRIKFPDFLEKEDYILDLELPGYKGGIIGEMELTACVIALDKVLGLPELMKIQRIIIYTDSMYVVDNLNNAKYVWPRQKWMTNSGPPVLNAELWKKLIKNTMKMGVRVDIEYVKGHSTDLDNRAVDRLAKVSARKAVLVVRNSKVVRRKTVGEKTARGSIKMEGQLVRVHVIESEYLKVQKIYKLRCEVVSRTNKFFGKTDFIFSDIPLRAGHIFSVRLNKDSKYPQITKVFREIKK